MVKICQLNVKQTAFEDLTNGNKTKEKTNEISSQKLERSLYLKTNANTALLKKYLAFIQEH